MPTGKYVRKRFEVDKQEFYNYYIVENHNRFETAEHFNCSVGLVKTLAKRYGMQKCYELRLAKGKKTKKELYGDENYNNIKQAIETQKEKYGCASLARKECRDLRDFAMIKKYGDIFFWRSDYYKNNVMYDIQHKIQEIKKENGTLNTSSQENEIYDALVKKYGVVKRDYDEDHRYPWHCDFYVPSEDLFIELQLFPTHYDEPFDNTNVDHLRLLEMYKTNPKNWIEEQRVNIWAGTDVTKRESAKKNKLNYVEVYKKDYEQWKKSI